ncbi:MAG: T9SS type A sorting domain-containing protein, partial [Bacteroidota bacterium]
PKIPKQLESIDLRISPNPFQSQTTIEYYLPARGKVELQVTDFFGKTLKTLSSSQLHSQGWQQIQFNSEDLPSGTYFVVLKSAGQLQSQKVVLMRN